jgi:hypothetical protein
MRVGDQMRKSIFFLGHENERGFTPYGTAFLGIASYEDMAAPLAITARHVIDLIPGDFISLRVNRKAGGSDVLRISKQNMILFEDKAIDLAIMPASIDHTIYDVFAIHLDSAKWKDQLAQTGLGYIVQGDEVCIAGLYTSHYGHDRNMPVVRIGHVAAIPEEKVLTPWGYTTGFLVEVHSIAGLSGSPVFWSLPTTYVENKQLKFRENGLSHIPVGIFIGYHVIESREDEFIVPEFQEPPENWIERDQQSTKRTKSEERRTGLGVVLPINFIFGIFENQEMKDLLKSAVEERRDKTAFRIAPAPLIVKVSNIKNQP